MTDKEKQEGNEAIRQFVGKEFHEQLCYNEFGDIDYSECKGFYHSSWSWLMPVVEKIEKVGFTVDINKERCSIWSIGSYSKQTSVIGSETKRDATWQAVVQFINWYTQQKQKV